MNLKERLLEIVNLKTNGNKARFYKETGLSNGSLNTITHSAKPKTIEMIISAYPDINKHWLLTGEGEMLGENLHITYPTDLQTKNVIGVPYYDIDITGSIVSSFSDIKEVPEYYIDYKPFNDCTAYFTMYGDSMYPRYCSGEVLAVKEVANQDIILWGESYLVITNSVGNDLKTVKRVYPAEDKDYITLRASNPDYKGDTLIPKECILGMYLVKGKIHRDQI